MDWNEARKAAKNARRKRNTVLLDIRIGIEFPCEWQAWGDDRRFERCVRHGEIRRAEVTANESEA